MLADASFLSDEFSHLVGLGYPSDDSRNLGILRDILREGCVKYRNCVPGKSPTSLFVFPNRRLSSGDMFVPTCTCYCDIPLADLGFHALKYGRFGLSFHRDFLIRRGARPVTYIPKRADDKSSIHGTTLLDHIQTVYESFRDIFVEPLRERAPKTARVLGKRPVDADEVVGSLHTILGLHFLAYVKPYDSQLSTTDLHYYYSEREWRITNYLLFVPEDVAHIFVASSEFIPDLVKEFPQYRDKIYVVKEHSVAAQPRYGPSRSFRGASRKVLTRVLLCLQRLLRKLLPIRGAGVGKRSD